MSNIEKIEVSKGLEILDGFLIPKEGFDKKLNGKFDKVVVYKRNQTLTIFHMEEVGKYKVVYEPYKRSLFSTKEYKQYECEIGYAYFTAEQLRRVRDIFLERDLSKYIDSSLKELNSKPNKVLESCKVLSIVLLTMIITAAICYGVYYLSNNPEVVAQRAEMKKNQDIMCDGHRGVKSYVYVLNINNVFECNDGTYKVYDMNKKELER